MKIGYLAVAAVAALALTSCGSKQKEGETVNVVDVSESLSQTEVVEDTVPAPEAAQQAAQPSADSAR